MQQIRAQAYKYKTKELVQYVLSIKRNFLSLFIKTRESYFPQHWKWLFKFESLSTRDVD